MSINDAFDLFSISWKIWQASYWMELMVLVTLEYQTKIWLLFVSWTAEALAAQVTEEHLSKGLVYPPFSNIRKISASISAAVAEKAYELGIYVYIFGRIFTWVVWWILPMSLVHLVIYDVVRSISA